MGRFYFRLWFLWAVRFLFCSIFFALLFASLITSILYLKQGALSLNKEILEALFLVLKFWFPIALSFSILLALFRGLKYVFNKNIYHHKLVLLDCKDNFIDDIGYGDLVKVFRKWLMLLVWIIASFIVVMIVVIKLFTSLNFLLFLNIYTIYILILLAGYFSLILLSSKFKKIKVIRC